jgi:hypothetical protein
LSIGLSYWCGSKYISSVSDRKELLSDLSLKLSCGLGTGKSGPWGMGHIADKRFGHLIPFFVFLIVTGNVDHKQIAVIVMILLLAPSHGYCKRHCLPFSVIPVTQSLNTSVSCSVRCERCLDLQLSIGSKKNTVSSQMSLFDAPWNRKHNFHKWMYQEKLNYNN